MATFHGFRNGREKVDAFVWDGVSPYTSPFDVVQTQIQYDAWKVANPVPVFDTETQKAVLSPGPVWTLVTLTGDEAASGQKEKEARILRAFLGFLDAGTATNSQIQRAIAYLLRNI